MSEKQMKLVEEVKSLFYNDYLIEAYEKITHLETEYQDDAKFLEILNSTEEVSITKDALNSANQCLELLTDLDSWELLKDEDNIATFSKVDPKEYVVRAEMIVETSIFPILALFSEIDLLHTWIEVIERSTLLAQPSSFMRLVWYKMNLPWPCSDRDLMVRGIGIPIPENRSVLLNIKSVNSSSFMGATIPPTEGNDVRLDITIACINMMIIEPEKTQVSMIAHTNPKLALIPQSLINFGTKHAVYFFMRMLREKAMSFRGSEFERRVNEKTEYYDKINEFYKRLFLDQ